MKKIKINTKNVLKFYVYAIFVIVMAASLFTLISRVVSFVKNPIPSLAYEHITITVPKRNVTYAYNQQMPKATVEAEIRKQAREFGLGEQVMVNLAICESGLDNLAKNKQSTALGVYQYLIKTWEETESFKNHKIARTDYKANIREAMIDISNGEEWRWECWK